MLIQPDCIPCILRMAVSSMRELQLEEDQVKGVLQRVTALSGLRGERWDLMSTEIIEQVMGILVEEVQDPDPFRSIKRRQNETILGIGPFVEGLVHSSEDPLRTAVKLAIQGNAMDLMIAADPNDIEHSLKEKLRDDISDEEYSRFTGRLKGSRRVVYFADNAGEIVLDRFLVELIQRTHGPDVVVVVRSVPALNDVTKGGAEEVGMDRIVRVLENGIAGPLPGTDLARCSEEVRDLVDRADLVISKGGGNYDSLTEAPKQVQQKTSFLFLSKCHPYCSRFGVGMFKPILFHIH